MTGSDRPRVRAPQLSRRVRRIWLSVLVTLVGTVLLTGVVVWIEAGRDTDLTDPTANVTAESREVVSDAPPIQFRDVGPELGIVESRRPGARSRRLPEDMAGGLAWGDYDGDGDPDLYVVNFPAASGNGSSPERGSGGANRLYRNDGHRFVDVAVAAGVADPEGLGMGATFVDHDGDGDLDLHVTNLGPNRLFRNRGDGTFEDVAASAGLDDSRWSTGAAWGDYDRDGDLDVYVCNYVDYNLSESESADAVESTFGAYTVPFTLNPNSFDPVPNGLHRNRGDGTFEDVSLRCRVENATGRSLAATFCDLDGDGWLDLYVNNDVSTNKLYLSFGAVTPDREQIEFGDLSTLTGTADPRGSMGLSVGELGEMCGAMDGLPDLFITHWVAQENALYESLLLPSGALEYRDRTRRVRLGEVSTDTVGWGSAFADLDLDGRPDLVVANGSTLERSDDRGRLRSEPMFLFWNGGAKFHDVAPRAGEATRQSYDARGLAVADFDGDGDLDLAVGIHRGRPLLLRNETPTQNRSLAVRFDAPDAALRGARVELRVAGRSRITWVGADVSYLSQHDTTAVFGLGSADVADWIEVRWTDGETSRREGVPAGRVLIAHPRRARGVDPAAPSR